MLPILSISQNVGGVLFQSDTSKFPTELISDPKFSSFNKSQLYPPNAEFKDVYDLWLRHQSCYWSVHENDPSIDRDKFLSAPVEFQEILLKVIGCITIGDTIVLDKIANGLSDKITSIETKAMLCDQEAREFTHKVMYSRMLDIHPDSGKFRSENFKNEFMGSFEQLAQKYAHLDDIRIQMFFIMMCENILFAPMFQTICYCAIKGYAPKLCDLNRLAMRDEYIHYEHARLQSAKFKVKINTKFARSILDEFSVATMRLFNKIIGTYDDGIFNLEHVRKHFGHVVHCFCSENNLYERDEFELFDKEFNVTPADYMNLPKMDVKINRMESNSTIYVIPGDVKPLDKKKSFLK